MEPDLAAFHLHRDQWEALLQRPGVHDGAHVQLVVCVPFLHAHVHTHSNNHNHYNSIVKSHVSFLYYILIYFIFKKSHNAKSAGYLLYNRKFCNILPPSLSVLKHRVIPRYSKSRPIKFLLFKASKQTNEKTGSAVDLEAYSAEDHGYSQHGGACPLLPWLLKLSEN